MLFTSLIFLFLFLPIVLVVNYALIKRRKAQNVFLFFSSMFFYAWGEPKFAIVLLLSILLNWFMALLIGRFRQYGKVFLGISIVFNLGLLFGYKYLDFAIVQFNSAFKTDIATRNIILPIGISFFTFQALSYVIDVFRGGKYQKNPLNVGLYISFFPQLIAGPIVRYSTIAEQIIGRKESLEKFSAGAIRFMQGFAKKVLIANSMAVIADKAFSLNSSEITVSFAWLGAIAYMMQIFFDFSGYSDMAIGLGKMFGFEFDENFNYPYVSVSITEFWRKWHISLSSWFRDYVYIPLGGSRCSKARNFLNLFIVWALTGIWHGANWTFILWGLLYFIVLVLEKTTGVTKFNEKHRIIGHLYSLLIICFLWVLFRAESISIAMDYYLSMFSGTFYSGMTYVYIRENIFFIPAAILFSTSIGNRINRSLVTDILVLIVFLVSIVYVINGTYNPFIYFNF